MGWLHKLSEPLPPPPRPKPKSLPTGDGIRDYDAAVAKWCGAVDAWQLDQLAEGLGVKSSALLALRIGWDGQAWTFPMVDAQGRIIGAQRRYLGGKKLCVKGGFGGMFMPENVIGDMTTQVYVCEGPTDTAYLLGLGVPAIGRFSATSCVQMLTSLLRVKRLDVVVIADNDKPDKQGRRVGLLGAERLATELVWIGQRVVKVIAPMKGKDVREWKPTLGTLNRCVAMAPIWTGKRD